MRRLGTRQIFKAAAINTTTDGNHDIALQAECVGVLLTIDLTAENGADSVLDAKLQRYDEVSGVYTDIVGASVVQFTAIGHIDLLVYPGIVAVANRVVNNIVTGQQIRLVTLVGGTSSPGFTGSISLAQLG